MANEIRIKRSSTNTSPSALVSGELAFTSNGDILYIGSPSGAVVAIGGARYPGVLTANQALIANTTGYINEIRTANAVITKIYAGGAHGTTGQVMVANSTGGINWAAPAPVVVGSNTEIQFNDGGTLGADADLVFNKLTNTLTSINIAATASLDVSSHFFANATHVRVANSAAFVANGSVGTAGQVLLSNGAGIYWGTDQLGVSSVATGSGLTGGTITSTGTLSVQAGDGIVANASGVFVRAGTGVTVNSTGVYIGQAVATTSAVTFGDLTVSGNTVLGDSVNDVIAVRGLVNTSIVPSANLTYDIGSSAMRWNNGYFGTGNFSGNMQVSGDFSVLGTNFTVSTNNVIVEDSMIQLASDNTSSDLLDIGFFGGYFDTAGKYTGLFRDQTDDMFKLFKGLTVAPVTTVNTTAAGYTIATLQAYLTSGAFNTSASAVNLTANSTVSVAIVANTLSLSTALPGTSGGTGRLTATNQDLLVANTTNGYNQLVLGAEGYVLQSSGGALAYGILDGGAF